MYGFGSEDMVYAMVAGAIVEMSPLRSIVPMLPPVVHSAIAGAVARPLWDTATKGASFSIPKCLDVQQSLYGAAGGFVANMYL